MTMTLAIAVLAAVLGSSVITTLVNAWINRNRHRVDTHQVLVDTDRAWIETVDKVRDFVLEEVIRLQEELRAAREETTALRSQLFTAQRQIADLMRSLEDAERRAQASGM